MWRREKRRVYSRPSRVNGDAAPADRDAPPLVDPNGDRHLHPNADCHTDADAYSHPNSDHYAHTHTNGTAGGGQRRSAGSCPERSGAPEWRTMRCG